MSKIKIYFCPICGKIAVSSENGAAPNCCGQAMQLLSANTVEASQEKHLPVISKRCGNVNVKVGSVAHPMTPEHFIKTIILETDKGYYVKEILPSNLPEAKFGISKEKVTGAYAYCNLHGLWYTEA